jgi:hypothetical protein
MTTLIEDIAAVLSTAGYSNVRAYRFDTATADQIVLIPGGGSAYIVSGGDIAASRMQVQIRHADLAAAEARAESIRALLHKNDDIDNTVTCVWDGRAPDYWTDDNNLHIFSVEFKIIRTLAD